MPIVRIPGKGNISFPDNMKPEQIQRIIETEILPAENRSKTNLAYDTAGDLISGVGQLLELPGQVYGLATGDFDTAALRGAKAVTQFGEGLRSEGLNARTQIAQGEIEKAAEDGVLSEIGETLYQYGTDPRLLLSGVLQSAPSMIGSLGAGAVAGKGVRIAVKEASEAAVRRAAQTAAIGTAATQQGASVATGVYDQALQLPDTEWAKSPEFQQRVASGQSPESAKSEMALSAARKTALAAGAVSAATAGLMPGGVEKTIFGAGKKGVIKSFLGEAGQEAIEEGGGALAGNVAVQPIQPEREIMQGVGQQATVGGLLGGIMGGGAGAVSKIGAPAAVPPPADIAPGVYDFQMPTGEGRTRPVRYTVAGFNPETGDVIAEADGEATEFSPDAWRDIVSKFSAVPAAEPVAAEPVAAEPDVTEAPALMGPAAVPIDLVEGIVEPPTPPMPRPIEEGQFTEITEPSAIAAPPARVALPAPIEAPVAEPVVEPVAEPVVEPVVAPEPEPIAAPEPAAAAEPVAASVAAPEPAAVAEPKPTRVRQPTAAPTSPYFNAKGDPVDVIDMIRRAGGVTPSGVKAGAESLGHDLRRTVGENLPGKRPQPGFFNSKGRTLDEIGQLLVDGGYVIDRPGSEGEVIDIINNAIDGRAKGQRALPLQYVGTEAEVTPSEPEPTREEQEIYNLGATRSEYNFVADELRRIGVEPREDARYEDLVADLIRIMESAGVPSIEEIDTLLEQIDGILGPDLAAEAAERAEDGDFTNLYEEPGYTAAVEREAAAGREAAPGAVPTAEGVGPEPTGAGEGVAGAEVAKAPEPAPAENVAPVEPSFPGMEPTAVQAGKARGEKMRPKVEQEAPGALFETRPPETIDIEDVIAQPEAAPSPKNTQTQSRVGAVKFDQVNGVGAVPYNQNINYYGFTAMMRPSKFLELAAELEEPNQSSLNYIRESIDEGKGLGSPFLNVDFKNGKVNSHDGRHRMMVIQEKNGDEPVPVHIFGLEGQRARTLDEGKINAMRSELIGEEGGVSTDNFSDAFHQGETIPAPEAAPAPAPTPESKAIFGDSDKHPKWATKHATGPKRIVYSDDEVALLESFSRDGARIFLPVSKKADAYITSDLEYLINNAKPNGLFYRTYSQDQISRLFGALEREAKADDARHAANPEGPFKDGNIVFTDGFSPAYRGIAQELIRLLGLKGRIFFTTQKDAADKANVEKYGWYGPFRVARGGGLEDASRAGYAQVFGPDKKDYLINVDFGAIKSENIATIAHELGHVLERWEFNNASAEIRDAILLDWRKWAKVGLKDKSAVEFINEMRTRGYARKFERQGSTKPATELTPWYGKFSEYFAEQVARWALTSDKPVSAIEKFFARIGRAIRSMMAKVTGNKYAPRKLMQDYLDSRAEMADGFAQDNNSASINEESERQESTTEAFADEEEAEEGAAPEKPFVNVSYEETNPDKWQRIFVNAMRRLNRTEEVIEEALGHKIPMSAKPSEAASLYEGRTNERLDALERNHFKKILNLITTLKLDPNDVDMFLYARAAKDRNAKIAARNENMPDGGSGLSNAQADAYLDMFINQGQYADLERVGRAVDEMVDAGLAARVAYGTLTQEQATALREAEPHYVPMKGHSASGDLTIEGDPNPHMEWAGRGFSITPRDFRKAKGRTSAPFSPLANAMADAQAAIIRGEKNRVNLKFLKEIARKYDSNAWKIFTDMNPDRDSEGRAINMGDNPQKYLVVKENGTPYYIRVTDPTLMRAMTKAGSKQVEGFTRSVVNAIGSATKLQSMLFTTLNPEFAVTNYARDIQAAIFNVLAEQDRVGGRLVGKKILGDVLKDLKSIKNMRSMWRSIFNHEATTAEQRTNNALFLQAKEDGAFTGWIMTESPAEQMDKIKKAVKEASAVGKEKLWYSTRDGAKKVVQAVQDANSVFENMTRFAVYKHSLAAGLSRDEAANMARNVTVDFNKKGEVSSVANALFAFFNATIQGHVQMFRSLTGRTSEGKFTRAQKLAGSMMALGALQAIMGALASAEDDDGKLFYDKIPENEKSRNIIIMNPVDGKTYIKIPLPYGYSFIHKFGVDTTEMMFGDKTAADWALGLVGGLRENFSPIPIGTNSMSSFLTSLSPTVSKPLFDLAVNENYFGSPIYNEPYDEEQSLSSVSRYSTPEGYKAVAEFMNDVTGGQGKVAGWADMSPEAIMYLVNSYRGGAGNFLTNVAYDGPAKMIEGKFGVKDAPIVRRVIGAPNDQVDLGEFYNRTAEMGPIVRQLKDSSGSERQALRRKRPVETNAAVIAARSAAEKELKEINKAKKVLMNRDSSDYTEAALDRLAERQHNVYVKFNRTYNRVEERER